MSLYTFVFDNEKHQTAIAIRFCETDTAAGRAAKSRLKARASDKKHVMEVWRGSQRDYAADRAAYVGKAVFSQAGRLVKFIPSE